MWAWGGNPRVYGCVGINPPEGTDANQTSLMQLSLRRRVGGRFDGAWFTESLIAEGSSRQTLYGVI